MIIQAGLFSASVTAFIVESYKNLIADSGEATVALLTRISNQLAAASNGSQFNAPSPSPDQVQFNPASSVIWLNAFWFLSLLLGLTCALMATMVQQWARHYVHAVDRRPAPHHRARIRAYLYEGLDVFKMAAMVDSIPTLLHVAVFLFFAGLVQFLFTVNKILAHMALAVVVICGFLYLFVTILPTLYRNSPYRTPLSSIFWRVMQTFRVLKYTDSQGGRKILHGDLTHGQETLAMESPQRNRRDFDALRWTLECLSEDSELEPFVEAIPSFLQQNKGLDGAVLITELLHDGKAQLGLRIVNLLESRGASVALSRATVCTRAVFFLVQELRKHGFTAWDTVFGPRLVGHLVHLKNDDIQAVSIYARCISAVLGHSLSIQLMAALRFHDAAVVAHESRYLDWIRSLGAMKSLHMAAGLPSSVNEEPSLDLQLQEVQKVFKQISETSAQQSKFDNILNTWHVLEFLEFVDELMTNPTIPLDAVGVIYTSLGVLSQFDPIHTDHETQMLLARFLGHAILDGPLDESRNISVKLPDTIICQLFSVYDQLHDINAINEARKVCTIYLKAAPFHHARSRLRAQIWVGL